MAEKSPISGRETYILDEDEIEELDEMSLTGVMRDITGTIEKIEFEDQEASPDDLELEDDWSSLLTPDED